MADYQEGQILTHKGTGDRVQLQNGEWVSIGPSFGTEVKKSTIPSLIRGAVGTSTAPRGVLDLAKRGIAYGTEKLGFPETAERMRADIDKGSYIGPGFFSTPPGKVMDAIEKVTGPLYHAQTTPGKFYSAAVEGVPGMGMGGATIPNAIKTLTSSLGSEALGQMAQGSDFETPARLVGSALGNKAPSAARRVITPIPGDPAHMAQARNVEAGGVRLGAGQFTGNPSWNAIEAPMRTMVSNESRYTPQAQSEDVSRALMRRTGANLNQLPTVPNVRARARELGQEREQLANRTTMPVDPQLHTDLTNASNQYRLDMGLARTGRSSGVPPPPLDQYINPNGPNSIVGPAGPGGGGAAPFTTSGRFGNRYLELRDQLRQAAETERSPALRQAYYRLRDAMDSAMNRGTVGTPDEGAFPRIHGQMADTRALQTAASATNPDAARGVVDPAAFANAHSNPTSPSATFARDTNAVLHPPSGADRAKAGAWSTIGGAAIGAGVPYLAHHAGFTGVPDPGIYGLLLGPALAGAPYIPPVAKAVMSPPVQSYLRNQLIPPSRDRLNVWNRPRRIINSVVSQQPRAEDEAQ
jgi:hypothetical protein